MCCLNNRRGSGLAQLFWRQMNDNDCTKRCTTSSGILLFMIKLAKYWYY